jgi:hypothetical protein
MRRIRGASEKAVAASILILTLAAVAAGAQEQHAVGSALLTPPEGWSRPEANGVTKRCGGCGTDGNPRYLPASFAQESRSVTVRLNTGRSGVESGSAMKNPVRSN